MFHFSDCDTWLDIDCSGDGRGPRVNGEFAAPYMGSGEFLPGGGLLVWRAIGTALEVVELRPPLQLHESAFRIHLPGARTFRLIHCVVLGKRGRLGSPSWRRMGGGGQSRVLSHIFNPQTAFTLLLPLELRALREHLSFEDRLKNGCGVG